MMFLTDGSTSHKPQLLYNVQYIYDILSAVAAEWECARLAGQGFSED